MTQKRIRLAIIGAGLAAKPHLEALAQLEDRIEVAGLLTRNPANARQAAAPYGHPVLGSLGEVAADPSVDGAIVLTPPNQRREIVDVLAAAGKHILIEKPVERTTGAARAIVEVCESRRVKLGVVLQHRFRAGARRLSHLIAGGDLGQIAVVMTTVPWWRSQDYYDVPGRGTLERDGGGVLMTQAIHSLDLMLSLAGPVAEVHGFATTTRLHRLEAEDFATAGVRYVSGAVGSIVATTAGYPGGIETIALHGSVGSATLAGGTLDVRWHDGRTEQVTETGGTGGGADPMAFPCDWHRDLIDDFAAAIREDRAPLVTGRAALRVHALIDGIIASSGLRQSTSVEQV